MLKSFERHHVCYQWVSQLLWPKILISLRLNNTHDDVHAYVFNSSDVMQILLFLRLVFSTISSRISSVEKVEKYCNGNAFCLVMDWMFLHSFFVNHEISRCHQRYIWFTAFSTSPFVPPPFNCRANWFRGKSSSSSSSDFASVSDRYSKCSLLASLSSRGHRDLSPNLTFLTHYHPKQHQKHR